MAANDVQVGGDHYRSVEGEQHWDRLVRLFGLDMARCYFIGNITSYVERYQKKDGLKDLKKAQHYIAKLIELEEAEQKRKLDLEVCKGVFAGIKPESDATKLRKQVATDATERHWKPIDKDATDPRTYE